MARIPSYSIPQVEARNIPNVRISDAPAQDIRRAGAAMAAGLQDVAGTVGKIAEQEQEKVNTSRLMEAQRSMSNLDASLLNDPEKGAYAQQGKNALGLTQRVMPEWDKQASAIADGLPSHLREKFSGFVSQRRGQANDRLMNHQLRESESYHDTEAQATATNFAAEALRNKADPSAVDASLNLGAAAVRERVSQKGLGVEAEKMAVREYLSKGYLSEVESYIGTDPNTAQARLDSRREIMDPADVAMAETKLRPLLMANEFDAIGEAAVGGGSSTSVMPVPRGKPSSAIVSAIETAAAKHGVPKEYLLALAEQESAFNPRAHNSEYGAAGLFQYIPSSAQERGIDPYNVQQAADAAAKDFAARMKAGGPDEAIMSHFAGPGGGNRGVKTREYLAQVQGRAMRWSGKREDQAAPVRGSAPATLGDALSVIKGDPRYTNPVWRKGAESAIEHTWSIKERDKADRENASLESFRAKVDAAPAGTPIARILGGDYAYAQQKGWTGTLESLATAKAEGRLVQTNPITFDHFKRMATENPTEFAKPATRKAINEASGELGTSDLGDLLGDWEAINDPKKAAVKQADWATESQRIATGVQLLGYDKLKGNKATQAGANFGMAFRLAKQAFVTDHKRAPVGKEADAIMRTVVQQFRDNPEKGSGVRAAVDKGVVGDDLRVARERLIASGMKNPTDAQVASAVASYYRE